MRKLQLFVAVITLTAILHAASALGDPLPGEILKFQQRPQNITAAGGGFPGHDEPSTAYGVFNTAGQLTGWQGRFMADDFADKFITPVVHLRWWGSYIGNQGFPPGVDKFLISFESDVPVNPNNPFSHPGAPLLNQIVFKSPLTALAPASGTFLEKPVLPSGPEQLYEYNAELHLGKDFKQQPDTVYWLKIVALVDNPNQGILWGWHNRDYLEHDPLASTAPAVVPGEHVQGFLPIFPNPPAVWHFQDDAVDGFVSVTIDPAMPIMPRVEQSNFLPQNYVFPTDGPDGVQQFSKDLAFELYTIPEPGSVAMLVCAAIVGWVGYRRMRRAGSACA